MKKQWADLEREVIESLEDMEQDEQKRLNWLKDADAGSFLDLYNQLFNTNYTLADFDDEM